MSDVKFQKFLPRFIELNATIQLLTILVICFENLSGLVSMAPKTLNFTDETPPPPPFDNLMLQAMGLAATPSLLLAPLGTGAAFFL